MHIIFKFDPCTNRNGEWWGAPGDLLGSEEEIASFERFLCNSLVDGYKSNQYSNCFSFNTDKTRFAVSFDSADIVLNYLEISGHTWEIRENEI